MPNIERLTNYLHLLKDRNSNDMESFTSFTKRYGLTGTLVKNILPKMKFANTNYSGEPVFFIQDLTTTNIILIEKEYRHFQRKIKSGVPLADIVPMNVFAIHTESPDASLQVVKEPVKKKSKSDHKRDHKTFLKDIKKWESLGALSGVVKVLEFPHTYVSYLYDSGLVSRNGQGYICNYHNITVDVLNRFEESRRKKLQRSAKLQSEKRKSEKTKKLSQKFVPYVLNLIKKFVNAATNFKF